MVTIPREVTKDLLAAGNNTISTGAVAASANSDSKDEAKLESAEDFQMNGLLPSDESSVQWLNACAPTVDPSAVVEERPSGRRDSFYMNPGAVDTRISTVSASTNLNALTPSDHVTVNDVLAANLIYKSYDMSVDPYYSSFKDELRSNENIMLILGLLVVFDAESVGIQDKDGVSRQFSFYSSLLQSCSKIKKLEEIMKRP
ncbi:hypothetical protein ANCCEY_14418 [Ancylostoma ceylanicum]|uniref:Uncharacterized protein n=1 Tax=Ancylostoma ceylanicum TaxID=53326 RepID=A0A0D6L9W2_9BILA|nr:hypothetical protein ANCCEY_14418 [Ancylostoma ceylanicum]